MEEDPFLEEKLPGILSEDPGQLGDMNNLRASKRSKISIAVSNASDVALEIGNIGDSEKEEGVIGNNDSGISPCEKVDNSHEVSLFLEDKDKGEI